MSAEKVCLLLLFIFLIISMNCAEKIPSSKHTLINEKINKSRKADNTAKEKKKKYPPSPYGARSAIAFDSTKTATGGTIELLLFSFPGSVIALPFKTRSGETAAKAASELAREINNPSSLYYADEGKGKILESPSGKNLSIDMNPRPVKKEYKNLNLIARAEKGTVYIKYLEKGEYAIRGTEKGIITIPPPPEKFRAIISKDKKSVKLTWKHPDNIEYDRIYISRNGSCIPPSSVLGFLGKRTSCIDDISKRHWEEWLVYTVVGIKDGVPSAAFLTFEE